MQKIKCFITDRERQSTPEEKVRQETAQYLVKVLGYEKSDIEVEFTIRVGSSKKRIDLAVFPKNMQHTQENIFAIVECKTKKFTEKEENQLKSYLSACANCEWGLLKEVQSQKSFRRIRRDGRHHFDEYDSIPNSQGQRPQKLSTDSETICFDDAKKIARSLAREKGLKNSTQWKKYCREHRPDQVPVYPDREYRGKGWNNWSDWLGSNFLSFADAKNFAQSLRLSGESEWREYCVGKLEKLHGLKPESVPSNPDKVYLAQGWLSWGDWLGTGNVAKAKLQYRPFKDARNFARELKLKSQPEWNKKSQNLPNDIPKHPDVVYKNNGWLDWYDWLGNEDSRKSFWDFKTAREFAHKLNIKTVREWKDLCQGKLGRHEPKPKEVPSNPAETYKGKGWTNWGDWLGTNTLSTRQRIFIEFSEARKKIHARKIPTESEWRKYCKGELKAKYGTKPQNIPANPDKIYEETGWVDWPDWLGSKNEKTI